MSRAQSGVQARIKAVAKHAFYVHCCVHCLNLVIVDAVKNVSGAGNFFSLLERLCVFLSGSYVHQKWLEVQRNMYDGVSRELQRLSDTRWACRHVACCNVMDRLLAILQVLDEISAENNPQRAVETKGILAQIYVNFVGCLVLFRNVLSDSNILSEMLQSKSVDHSKGVFTPGKSDSSLALVRTKGKTLYIVAIFSRFGSFSHHTVCSGLNQLKRTKMQSCDKIRFTSQNPLARCVFERIP